jgi:hypothetical protein
MVQEIRGNLIKKKIAESIKRKYNVNIKCESGEMVYSEDLKSCAKGMRVRVPPLAPLIDSIHRVSCGDAYTRRAGRAIFQS